MPGKSHTDAARDKVDTFHHTLALRVYQGINIRYLLEVMSRFFLKDKRHRTDIIKDL